jgi:ribonucleoside-diphosphate reductase alpha chain
VSSNALALSAHSVAALQVIRRNGAVVEFNPEKISVALTKAFLAVEGSQSAVSSRVREVVARLTDDRRPLLTRRLPDGGTVHIEDIQDQVELALMRSGQHDVARAYVLYRERRAAERAAVAAVQGMPALHVTVGGERRPLDLAALLQTCAAACAGLGDGVSAQTILDHALKNLYDGVALAEVKQALILAARTLIERDPAYDYATARLLLASLNEEKLAPRIPRSTHGLFPGFHPQRGISAELLDPRLADYDLDRLAAALKPERNQLFGYLGLQTLYDRYFLHIDGRRIETPQIFFMRVAMGLALNEIDRETRAIEFYDLISSFDFMCSTPTLFNSGTLHSQLSSCYLTTVADDLDGIYQSHQGKRPAAEIRRRPGQRLDAGARAGQPHQGHQRPEPGCHSLPQGGQRHGGRGQPGRQAQGRGVRLPGNLAPGHRGIPRAAQEHRRRAPPHARHEHRQLDSRPVHEAGDRGAGVDAVLAVDVPDLHDKAGAEPSKAAYEAYEAKAAAGQLKLHKKIPAVQLWRKMLTMLFETGHPWITFKDACNLRSPQQHVGVVHSAPTCAPRSR